MTNNIRAFLAVLFAAPLMALWPVLGIAQTVTDKTTVFAPVAVAHVTNIVLTRGTGTLINWQMEVCAQPGPTQMRAECSVTNGVLTQPQSNTVTNLVKTVMIPAHVAAQGLVAAP